MKYFLIALIGLSFSSLISAQTNVAGTWVWSGAGCRDTSLSPNSHITKPKSQNPFGIAASQLTLNADGSAAMTLELSNGEWQDETGSYTVRGNEVVIMDPNHSETNPAFVLDIVGEDLIFNSVRVTGDDTPDNIEEHISACTQGQVYVYVFSRID